MYILAFKMINLKYFKNNANLSIIGYNILEYRKIPKI